MAESFFATLEFELLRQNLFASRSQALNAVSDFIEGYKADTLILELKGYKADTLILE